MEVIAYHPTGSDSLFNSPTLPSFQLPNDVPTFEVAAKRLIDLHKQASFLTACFGFCFLWVDGSFPFCEQGLA